MESASGVGQVGIRVSGFSEIEIGHVVDCPKNSESLLIETNLGTYSYNQNSSFTLLRASKEFKERQKKECKQQINK